MESAAPVARLLLRFSVLIPLLRTLVGQQTWAVTALTWKAAFRFRLFWVLAVLLLGSVVILPLLIKDDGTARGFIQITLTYTLSVITTLLGLSTLWLACGTLARDIEDASIQMVVVKPIARWQVWLGKWLGLVLLNATLLTVAGGGVYGMLQWRTARIERDLARAKTAKDEKLAVHLGTQLSILRSEIFVARASLKEPAPDINVDVEQQFQKIPNRDSMSPEQQQQTRLQLKERITAFQQVVPPGHRREWTLDLGLRRHLVQDQPLFLRVKFHAAQSIAFNIAIFAIYVAFGIVSFVLTMITSMLHFPVGFLMVFLWPIIGVGVLIAWIYLMYKAYNNEKYKLPIIGNMVENMVR